jgi:hypothetical protein
VREHRDAAGAVDPADRLRQRRPLVLDVAGLARHEVVAEHVLHVARVPGFHEVTREMRARHELLARHVLHRAFVRARDARGGERGADALRAPGASDADGLEPGGKRAVVRVDVERDHVDRESCQLTDSSLPCTKSMPTSRAACVASASPDVSSWSVSARTSTPREAARRTTGAGDKSPSE